HAPRREAPAYDRAIFAMNRRVHVEEMAEWRRRARFHAGIVHKHQQPRSIEKQARLLGYLNDVGVLRDRPEGVGIQMLAPENRLVLAQPGPLRVRIAVLRVMVGTDDVDRVE